MFAIGFRVWTAPKLPDLAPTVAHLDSATGAWANASAQQVRSVEAIERDLRAQLWHVDRLLNTAQGTLQAGSGALDTLQAQITHVSPLLDSLKATSDAIPPAITHITDTADGLQPVLVETAGAVGDVRRFINQPALTDTITSAASITGSAAGIAADSKRVADKLTADYFKPVRWYMKPLKRSGELIDIGAAVARHAP